MEPHRYSLRVQFGRSTTAVNTKQKQVHLGTEELQTTLWDKTQFSAFIGILDDDRDVTDIPTYVRVAFTAVICIHGKHYGYLIRT